jgi:hypothetical protein
MSDQSSNRPLTHVQGSRRPRRRIEQRVDGIGQLRADRLGETGSALDHDIRARE